MTFTTINLKLISLNDYIIALAIFDEKFFFVRYIFTEIYFLLCYLSFIFEIVLPQIFGNGDS